MTDKVKVGGLLGALEAEAEGKAWEFEGRHLALGLGATEEAVKLAVLGQATLSFLELYTAVQHVKRKKGRPRISPIETLDAKRAFLLWWFAHRYAEDDSGQAMNFTNEVQIRTAELLVKFRRLKLKDELPGATDIFLATDSALMPSISRGRSLLGINRRWQSETCEILIGINRK